LNLACATADHKSKLDLSSAFASDFNITEVRVKIQYVSDNGGVTCGPYWNQTTSSRTIISGTSIQVNGTCNNPPNRYSDLVGTGFFVEFYGPLNVVTELLRAGTACGGSFTMMLSEIWVR
jgi:hypothetical protein